MKIASDREFECFKVLITVITAVSFFLIPNNLENVAVQANHLITVIFSCDLFKFQIDRILRFSMTQRFSTVYKSIINPTMYEFMQKSKIYRIKCKGNQKPKIKYLALSHTIEPLFL